MGEADPEKVRAFIHKVGKETEIGQVKDKSMIEHV